MNNQTEAAAAVNQTEELGKSEEPNGESTGKLADSEEMQSFYHALAMVQSNAMFRVMSRKDKEDIKKQAVIETERLFALLEGGKCRAGTVWNEITRQCE